jgi:hypothetical protein
MSSGPNDDADRGRPAHGAGRGHIYRDGYRVNRDGYRVNRDGYRVNQDGYRPSRREPDGA